MSGARPLLLLTLANLGVAALADSASRLGSGSTASAAALEVKKKSASTKEQLTADLKGKRRALSRAANNYNYRSEQLEYLSEQLAGDEAEVAESRRTLRQMTAERNDLRRRLYSSARHHPDSDWARMKSVNTRMTPVSTAYVHEESVSQHAVQSMLEHESEKMQADIGQAERRNAALRTELAGRRGALDMGRLAARVGEERRELRNFKQAFDGQQAHLAAMLDNVISPWEQQWKQMAYSKRRSSLTDAAILEPEMHMKAFQEMQSFDTSMRQFAQQEACFFDEHMGDQQQQLDTMQGMGPPVAY